MSSQCEVPECVLGVHAKGYCQKHYRLLKKHGKPQVLAKEERRKPGPKPDPSKPRSRHGTSRVGEGTKRLQNMKERTDLRTGPQSVSCRRGHELTPENTYVYPAESALAGHKVCKLCRANSWRRARGSDHLVDEPVGVWNRHKTHCPSGHEYNAENTRYDDSGWRTCKICNSANSKKASLARRGLSPELVEELQELQENACAICREEFTSTPHIDHDHRCCPKGSGCRTCVRGLLCSACNHMLGKAKDDPARLRAGAKYLEDHQSEN